MLEVIAATYLLCLVYKRMNLPQRYDKPSLTLSDKHSLMSTLKTVLWLCQLLRISSALLHFCTGCGYCIFFRVDFCIFTTILVVHVLDLLCE